MHCSKYSLLVTILCGLYSQVFGIESLLSVEETTVGVNPKNDDVKETNSAAVEFISFESNVNLTEKDTQGLKTDDKGNLKPEKRDIENITFNDIKPFLLFPILPFLFPPKDDESLTSGKTGLSSDKNETLKIGENPPTSKPFLFFDFAFNIRRIPINNVTDRSNDTKIIKIEQLSDNDNPDKSPIDSLKNRRRRNTKMETPGFFDDTPLFPESELDEFLPKPDLFFPDLPLHYKPKKLSRRKRNQKKTELKNDFKSFIDAFDEAFMRTKREFELADPILNFLRGSEQPFGDEKKESTYDLFNPMTEIQKEPAVKWSIHRNVKRLNDHKDGLAKDQNSPTIIVDKVVKIGEFRMSDDDISKKKLDNSDPEKSRIVEGEGNSKINDEIYPRNIFELLDGKKGRKRSFSKTSDEENNPKILKRSSSSNSTPSSLTSKIVSKLSKKNSEIDLDFQKDNSTEKVRELVKMLDSLKEKMESNMENLSNQNLKKAKLTQAKENMGENHFQDDLRKNLTKLLQQFLVINKNLDDAKLMEKLELNERDDARVLDLTDKETLQSGNSLGKGPTAVRQKKDAYFEDEYVSAGKTERQVADLNYMFLNVTLPTIFVFAVVLLVCFYSLQVKGKICTKLFRPRQVLIVNDEATMQLKNPGAKKVQPP